MRRYTAAELDDLRRVVEKKWEYGTYRNTGGLGRTYRAEEKTACVEELTRTRMLAGHAAADLIASEASREPQSKVVLQRAL